MPDFLGPREFTKQNLYDGGLAIHIAQVFDLLDFGYRGVSSHETASLGSAAYYTTGFEGSDTVAGTRMILQMYNGLSPAPPIPPLDRFSSIFEMLHGARSRVHCSNEPRPQLAFLTSPVHCRRNKCACSRAFDDYFVGGHESR